MLKLIGWISYFEFWNLLKVLSQFPIIGPLFPDKRVFNFAFGANLSAQVLYRRKITPYSVEPFILENHELRFTNPASFQGVAFASIHPCPQKKVYGTLLEISFIDWKRLNCFEMVPFVKRHRCMWYEHGQKKFFSYVAMACEEGLRPTEEYKRKILQGISLHFSHEPNVIAQYEEINAISELIPIKNRLYLTADYHWPKWLFPLQLSLERIFRSILFFDYDYSLLQKMIRVKKL